MRLIALGLVLLPSMALAQRVSPSGVSSVMIPPSSIGLDLCLGEGSGAYANPKLAVTLLGPARDQTCALLRQSKWAFDSLHPSLSYQIMCLSPDWRDSDAVTEHLCKLAPRERRPWWKFW